MVCGKQGDDVRLCACVNPQQTDVQQMPAATACKIFRRVVVIGCPRWERILVRELKREQVTIAEHEVESHDLARKTADIGGVFPCRFLIDRISEQLVRVSERETREWLAVRVLKFDAQTAGCGRGVIQQRFRPTNFSGFVVRLPPDSGACRETKPSRRIV